METGKNSNATGLAGHGVPVVNIDGARIKKIREEKGLTQLYLSEVVGVTTDTISRWENRRYPSIKLENARNLAQALEVELDDIQEKGTEGSEPEKKQQQVQFKKKPAPRLLISISLILFFTVFVTFLVYQYFSSSKPPAPDVTAKRILPHHVPPGQTFPVLIQVDNPAGISIALILKESVPPGTIIENGVPFFTNFDPKNNELKWIGRTENNRIIFAYLARAPKNIANDTQLVFNGSVTVNQKPGSSDAIGGDTFLTIAPYHWADINRDSIIDDEEILAVYDRYSDISGLGFNRDLIDDIWAGNGYKWDEQKGQYRVLNP